MNFLTYTNIYTLTLQTPPESRILMVEKSPKKSPLVFCRGNLLDSHDIQTDPLGYIVCFWGICGFYTPCVKTVGNICASQFGPCLGL